MISLKIIRDNKETICSGLSAKNFDTSQIDLILKKDLSWRTGIAEVEKLKEERNSASKEVSILKKEGKPSETIIEKMQSVSLRIKELDTLNSKVKDQIDDLILAIPNIPHHSVPLGKDETSNIVVREWGKKTEFEFPILGHAEIAQKLNLLDFRAGSLISGAGFPVYIGLGAKLERSLINFMLDTHVENGYKETFPPFMVNRKSMETTGQLPKFYDDMYELPKDELFAIPTAEVPVTNYYRDQIVDEEALPIKFAAYSACFRREAGSYGKDTKGLLRLHQFNKVELVKFSNPKTSYDELESILKDAEKILQILGLHYRVIELCTGDLSFSASKCYDIEVWSPFEEKYLEVSSCSNFEGFQSYRGNMRFRSSETGKMEFLHTLNGSGLATPRLMVALLENFQNKDGTLSVPDSLKQYMGIDSISND